MITKEEVIALINDLGVGTRPHNDSLFEDANIKYGFLKKYGLWGDDEEDIPDVTQNKFFCRIMGCNFVFESLSEHDLHYNSCHRYSCSECKKTLHSPHLLDLHICENHDSYFAAQVERKPMFQCYLKECKEVFRTATIRKDHCLTVHKFPNIFPFEVPRADSSQSAKKGTGKKKQKKKINAGANSMDTDATSIKPEEKKTPKENDRKQCLGSGIKSSRQQFYNFFVQDLAESLPMDVEKTDQSGSKASCT